MTVASDQKDDFVQQFDPFRRELLAHCYRMTGSIHDAEDLLQETYIRAWRGYANYEGRSSLRTWLYRIATNTCLTALEGRAKRPLPTGLGAPSSGPTDELVQNNEIPWLEPIADSDLADATDPASIVVAKESVRLAFVASLQHLSSRQRAVLLMREVLQWKASEVAEVLATTTTAVNSLLQRARERLDEIAPELDNVEPIESAELQKLLSQYVECFESYDIDRLVTLFTSDAVWEMPPFVGWYQGGETIGSLIRNNCPANGAGDMRMVSTSANGQPAYGLYMLSEGGVHRPFQLHVLDVDARGVGHVACFFDLSLFDRFGLPDRL
ncbi:sigma-70 family RNA polymerase sigma factor [Rhodococcus sp. ARC_M12]|uniref:sigma-70 family RNA polymerase sigma factor n=1 Tax=unclassified Rhodococcus (in: high G+C Gram-positive bacteria) TaxID=192944 RepID=UPI001FB31619|nr:MULTISPECIES: sigma-70 family RNA polymerase sigma factor [unclassified Rhodococcus (in: high G+C Gram-positive bacteria)]MCJ0893648.1 sigma-70 family RNA polymerase sigma factor [Rhodococcus sp. ARC_M5]MCJ0978602.1 sigma-70 family RNA polymerase sigma factor [Rhodococcus sp. ARC_M12]